MTALRCLKAAKVVLPFPSRQCSSQYNITLHSYSLPSKDSRPPHTGPSQKASITSLPSDRHRHVLTLPSYSVFDFHFPNIYLGTPRAPASIIEIHLSHLVYSSPAFRLFACVLCDIAEWSCEIGFVDGGMHVMRID